MKSGFVASAFLLALLSIGGCATLPMAQVVALEAKSGESLYEAASACQAQAEARAAKADEQNKQIRLSNLGKSLDQQKDLERVRPIDDFLDCMMGPIDPKNVDLRSFRGHIIVAMMAEYGAFAMRHDPVNQASDAAELLKLIEKAEKQLWTAKLNGLTTTDSLDRVDRIFTVIKVMNVARKPTTRALKSLVGKVIEAVQGSPTAAIQSTRDVLDLLKRAMTVEVYARAYLETSRTALLAIKDRQPGKQPDQLTSDKNDWKPFDDRLDNACKLLSFLTGDESGEHHCMPSRS